MRYLQKGLAVAVCAGVLFFLIGPNIDNPFSERLEEGEGDFGVDRGWEADPRARKISERTMNRTDYREQFVKFGTILKERHIASLNPLQEEEFISLIKGWITADPLEALRAIDTTKGKGNREAALVLVGFQLLSDSEMIETALSEGVLGESDLLMMGHRLYHIDSSRFAGRFLTLAYSVTLKEATRSGIEKIVIRNLENDPLLFQQLEQVIKVLPQERRWEFLARLFTIAPGGTRITSDEFRRLRKSCRNDLEVKSLVETHCYSFLSMAVGTSNREPIEILNNENLRKEEVGYTFPIMANFIAAREGWDSAIAGIRGSVAYSEGDHSGALVNVVLEHGNAKAGMDLLSSLDPKTSNIQEIVTKGAEYYLNDDVDRAAEWIDQMKRGKVRQVALGAIVDYFRRHGSLDEAAVWGKSINPR